MNKHFRRRLFLQSLVLLSGSTATRRSIATAVKAQNTSTGPELSRFHYKQVQLDRSPLLEQLTHNRDLYMEMDEDKLLKPFRVRAHLPAPGQDMGGWYDASDDFHIDATDFSTANWHGYIPGHSFGQYVSGLARCYAASGDPRIKTKLARLVTKYSDTIHPRFFAGYPLPAYTYDKLVIGLVDAYQYAGLAQAKAALDRLTDVVLPFLPERALTREERRQRPYTQEAEIWDETYTLPEHLFLAWRAGMGDRYKDLALRYLQDEALFDPLARGVSPFKGKHAYSHVNALSSAIQAYLATGNPKYVDAARNGFAFVLAQSYATGGWGANEELLAPDDTETLLASLTATHRSFETPCGAFGHFKIARSLLQITKSSHYGDSMERILYNTILGAKPTQTDGRTFYYADYSNEARKVFRGEAWPCCSGTFIQLASDYGISTYLHEDALLYVNLYVPSQVRMAVAGREVTVRQVTSYPVSNTSTLEVRSERPAQFGIALRIPAWAGKSTSVRVNGMSTGKVVNAGEFFVIDRAWVSGDRIEISFDMTVRLEAINPAHPEYVSLHAGPLVLFPILPAVERMRDFELLQVQRVSESTWIAASTAGAVTFKPYMFVRDERYRLYTRLAPLDLVTAAGCGVDAASPRGAL